jgi:hypothetical protein
MADVFISYSKAQRSDAERLAEELQSKGFSVWWDSELISGDNFTNVILGELDKAHAVIVIWSSTSVKSDWVRSEANRARSRGVLIPVRALDTTMEEIPPPFDQLQTVELTNWIEIEAALGRLTAKRSQSERVPDDHLVILVHGIRTHAHWMAEVKPALEQAGFSVAPTSYGVLPLSRFLSPFATLRTRAVTRVAKDVETAISIRKRQTGAEPKQVSVIAHSFGTFVIGRILTDYKKFKWCRIIFCGSVIRDDFPFDEVLDQFSAPLVNEIGTRDYWPAIAESLGWGYGSVGSNGFNRPPVETRWHQGYGHSDFLTAAFCKDFWIPFLNGEKPRAGDKPTDLPLLIRAISFLPLRWVAPAILLGVIVLAGYLAISNHADSAAPNYRCSLNMSWEEWIKCSS